MIRTIGLEAAPAIASTELHPFLRRSLKSQWRDYRKEFARCRRKFSEQSVHRVRIESRRLLSTLEVLAAVTPGKPLKAATRAAKKRLRIFARLRDTHVQLLAVEEWEREFSRLKDFRRDLARREKQLTKRVARKLNHTGLHGVARPIEGVRKELRALISERGRDEKDIRSVADALEEAFDTVTRRLRAIDPANPVTIHRTRVAFKKFRYMVEVLRPVLPGIGDPMLERMREYQSRMGDIQDITVLRSSLEEFLRKHEYGPGEIARIRAALERRRADLVSLFMNEAEDLFNFALSKKWVPASRPRRTNNQTAH